MKISDLAEWNSHNRVHKADFIAKRVYFYSPRSTDGDTLKY